MAIQTSSIATAGNLTRYETEYRQATEIGRTYDQFASRLRKTFEPNGTTIQVAWAAPLQARPTTAVGNETSDFDPQTFRDVSTTITLAYLNDGLKAHDLVRLKSSLDPMAQAARLVGANAVETIDALARRKATEGSLVIYGDASVSSRVTLDLGTAGHHFNFDRFAEVKAMQGSWANERNWFVVIDDFQYQDLITAGGGSPAGVNLAVLNSMGYTERGDKQLFNYELTKLAGVRILVSPFAKAFYGAGADNASAVATTLSAAANAGARTISVASATNVSTSKWLTIGTVQTSTESDTTILTEIVRVGSVSGTDVTIIGKGPGGGLRYDHASGEAVENGDTVHAAVFGHPESMAVEYSDYGRYGKLVPPFQDGNAKQWTTICLN